MPLRLVAPDGRHIFYLSDGQLWSVAPDGDTPPHNLLKEASMPMAWLPTAKPLVTKRVHAKNIKSSDIFADAPDSKARVYDDLMVRHWDYWDEGDYSHIFVANMERMVVESGTDIMADEPWDAPLAPYFDAAEIAWSSDSRRIAYTCKPLTGAAYAVSTASNIFIYDLQSGSKRNICTEQVEMPGNDRYHVWSPDDSRIASAVAPCRQRERQRTSDVWNAAIIRCAT